MLERMAIRSSIMALTPHQCDRMAGPWRGTYKSYWTKPIAMQIYYSTQSMHSNIVFHMPIHPWICSNRSSRMPTCMPRYLALSNSPPRFVYYSWCYEFDFMFRSHVACVTAYNGRRWCWCRNRTCLRDVQCVLLLERGHFSYHAWNWCK